jgi:hypothetical protein
MSKVWAPSGVEYEFSVRSRYSAELREQLQKLNVACIKTIPCEGLHHLIRVRCNLRMDREMVDLGINFEKLHPDAEVECDLRVLTHLPLTPDVVLAYA